MRASRLGLQRRLRMWHPFRAPMRRELARQERATPAGLRAYQEQRMRGLVRFAARRSPFYRRWFRETGLDPRDIRTLDDLRLLPVIDRRLLAADPEDFLAYPRHLVWPAHSSGTSGEVVTAYRSPGSSVYELTALERQWSWFGVTPGSRRVILRGERLGADPVRHRAGDRALLVSSFHLTREHFPAIVEAMVEHDPEVIDGWPSSLLLLASLLGEAGRDFPVRAVITSSEVMTEGARAAVQSVFGGPVVGHYGQTERVVMTGNCPAGGHHVFDDYGILEQLPLTDSPDRYELVGTALHNWAFPLLRYRTGDEVGPPPTEPCPCGRAFGLLGEIDGRVEDSFTAADGRHIPLPHCLIKDLTGLREVQIAQRAPGTFELRMVPGASFDRAAVVEQARRNIERTVGPGQELSFRVMDRIPRPRGGKLRPAIVLEAPTD